MKRTLLRAEIVALEPFRISAPEMGGSVAQRVATNANQVVYVPATSLAGSLRAHLARTRLDRVLMGSDVGELQAAPDAIAVPSALRLVGTRTTLLGRAIQRSDLRSRGQTAIDPHRGAADAATLRGEVESVSAGAKVVLYLRIDRDLTAVERAALGTWIPSLGGSRTSGLGAARLASLKVGTLDLSTESGLRQSLKRAGPALWDAVATEEISEADPIPPTPVLDLRFQIVDGLLCGGDRSSDEASSGSRAQIATHHKREDHAPWIEGSTLKGILRGRAEFILRSIAGRVCEDRTCGESPCIPCRLFGSTERRGALIVRGSKIEGAVEATRTHVGIDRITGGARRNLLFTEQIVLAGRFTLRVDLIGDAVSIAERALLDAVVRDIHDGYVGIGSRVTRGLGTVRLVDARSLSPARNLAQFVAETSS